MGKIKVSTGQGCIKLFVGFTALGKGIDEVNAQLKTEHITDVALVNNPPTEDGETWMVNGSVTFENDVTVEFIEIENANPQIIECILANADSNVL